MLIKYLYWVPLVILLYSFQAWLSYKNSIGGAGNRYMLYLWFASMIPLWAFVSRLYAKEELNFVGGVI